MLLTWVFNYLNFTDTVMLFTHSGWVFVAYINNLIFILFSLTKNDNFLSTFT